VNPNVSIDPRSIKLIAAFSVGITLDEQDPLEGAFLTFSALNKELAEYLLDHKDLLTEISFKTSLDSLAITEIVKFISTC